jgi:hypothetical protein
MLPINHYKILSVNYQKYKLFMSDIFAKEEIKHIVLCNLNITSFFKDNEILDLVVF